MFWNQFKNIASLVLIVICFILSDVNIFNGALSEFSAHNKSIIPWTITLHIQAVGFLVQYKKIEAWVCSLSLLYISLYGLGEFLHNEVAVLFFLSCLVLVFRYSYKTGTGILLISLSFLFLFKGYAMFELVFCVLVNAFIQQVHYRNTHSVIR